MAGDNLLYDIYERRLAARIDPATVPHHVGVILDGNRRWAKSMGFGAAQGHKRGADKIEEFLGWAEQMGVQVVTLWLLSTDNLSRDPAELSPLLDIIAHAVDELAETGRWSLRLVGAVDLLPEPLAERLRAAVVRSRPSSAEASGAGGSAGEAVETDPDLVIRTSGEQRLSGFLLWQSVHSEYYFCEVNWPAFRRVDFLRALRDFASRERRLGR